jgi:methionyl-tRNA formyltransferase
MIKISVNVISIGNDQIIPAEKLKIPTFGILIFHSSDLPRGRGWAPLFNTIMNHDRFLVQSLIYAEAKVDSGPIIAKAKYPLDEFYSIDDLRKIDDELTLILIKKYIHILWRQKVQGQTQDEALATHYRRRYPADGEIKDFRNLNYVYDLIRALPKEYPAFFIKDGVRINLFSNIERDNSFKEEHVIIEDYIS